MPEVARQAAAENYFLLRTFDRFTVEFFICRDVEISAARLVIQIAVARDEFQIPIENPAAKLIASLERRNDDPALDRPHLERALRIIFFREQSLPIVKVRNVKPPPQFIFVHRIAPSPPRGSSFICIAFNLTSRTAIFSPLRRHILQLPLKLCTR